MDNVVLSTTTFIRKPTQYHNYAVSNNTSVFSVMIVSYVNNTGLGVWMAVDGLECVCGGGGWRL